MSQRPSFVYPVLQSAPGAAVPARRLSSFDAVDRASKRTSHASSYRYSSVYRRYVRPPVENTYQLGPSANERFHACYAEPLIAQVLQVRSVVENIRKS